MIVVIWNLEWASPESNRGKMLAEQIQQVAPDVICFTEVLTEFVPEGYTIEANPDYGYPHDGNRRKVILWSKTPWEEADQIGSPALPSGRFVSGVTKGIRFVGVCIPWKDAHVKHGTKDRQPWEDHLTYCQGLKAVLAQYSKMPEPVCILGDFNQRLPRKRQPEHVYQALQDALPSDYTITTRGLIDPQGKQLIDHMVSSPCLVVQNVETINRLTSEGMELSDHTGVVAALQLGDR